MCHNNIALQWGVFFTFAVSWLISIVSFMVLYGNIWNKARPFLMFLWLFVCQSWKVRVRRGLGLCSQTDLQELTAGEQVRILKVDKSSGFSAPMRVENTDTDVNFFSGKNIWSVMNPVCWVPLVVILEYSLEFPFLISFFSSNGWFPINVTRKNIHKKSSHLVSFYLKNKIVLTITFTDFWAKSQSDTM